MVSPLHLNKCGTTSLTKTFSKMVNLPWYCDRNDGGFYKFSDESTVTIWSKSHLKNSGIKNSKNIILAT